MAYIGNPILSSAFPLDTFTGDGTTVAFTMTYAPASTNSMVVCVDGVKQAITTYGINGYTLTFSEAPPSSANIEILYLGIPASGVTNTAYRTVTEFTATASQTNFTVPSYSVGFVTVFQNGIKLGSADFTATDGVTVVLGTGATAGDLVAVESFYVSSMNGAISQNGGAFSGNVQFPKGTAAAPSIFFNEGTTSGFYSNVNTVGITTNGTSAVYIDDIQEVGIGTVTPTNKLTVVDNSANAAVRITQTGAGPALVVEDSANPDSTPFVVDASGTVVIGHTSSITNGSVATTPVLQQHGLTNNASSIGLSNWSSTAARTPSLNFNRSISDTVGTRTSLSASGTALGMISFTGDDGTNWIESARIASFIDGTPGTNDMPGRLVFYTTADGGSSLSERMRISAAGDVGIGASPSARLTVDSGSTGLLATFNSTATNGGYISGYSSGTAIWDFGTAKQAFNTGTSSDVGINTRSGFLGFGTNTTERMRIDTSGRLLIGTSSVPVTTVVTTGLVVYSQSLLGTSATGTNVNKDFRLLSGAYSGNAATILTIDGVSGNNILYYGGGTGAGEPATYHTWYTGTAGTLGVGTERMRLDNSGNLGLGVTPSAWSLKAMDINTTTGIYGGSNSSGFVNNAYYNAGWKYKTTNTAGSYEVVGNEHRWGIAASGTAGNAISFTQAMTLDASGRLGLGAVPSSSYTGHTNFQIGAQAILAANQGLSTTGQTYLSHNLYFDTSGTWTVFNTSSANEGCAVQLSDGEIIFQSSAATTGIPSVTQILEIKKDYSLSLQGATIKTGTGITFPATQNASSDANTLDDYEEGTWTPTVWGGGNISSAYGSYIKIGSMVWVGFRIEYGATGNSDAAGFTSLPFTVGSNNGANQALTCVGYSTYGSGFYAQAQEGSTRVVFYNLSGSTLVNSNFSSKSVYGGVVYKVA